MDQINLNGELVNYELSFKKNKNTYFYFKKEGYIKINASKNQTKKQIIKHMMNNELVFLNKLHLSMSKNIVVDKSIYYLFGTPYKKVKSDVNEIIVNHQDKVVLEPKVSTDQLEIKYKQFEKKTILFELDLLKQKYLNNSTVDIMNIIIKTRYTKTRFGSCNARKKTINMNTNLIHYDIKYLEYVFLHEISHLMIQNHSSKFYDVLEVLCPNYKQLRKELRKIYR